MTLNIEAEMSVNFGQHRGEKAPILGARAFISHTKSIPIILQDPG
jgi:hypothetical protein